MSRTDTTSTSSLGRILRGAFMLAVLLVVAFGVGQIMLAAHVADETRYLVAGAVSIAAVLLCFGRDRG